MSGTAQCLDPIEVEKNWYERGFSCCRRSDDPGEVWKDFAQDTDEIILVLAGELEVEVGGTTRRLPPGAELIIPTGARHTIRTKGEGRSTWLHGYGREYAHTD